MEIITPEHIDIPFWVVALALPMIAGIVAWVVSQLWGANSVKTRGTKALRDELADARVTVDRLKAELAAMEATIQRLRGDLAWEREENMRLRLHSRNLSEIPPEG